MGLRYDPLSEVDEPYLQLIRPGIVELPPHEAEEAGRWGSLAVAIPPWSVLIAARLIRAEARDIANIFFLYRKFAIDRANIAFNISLIPGSRQPEKVRENLVCLGAISDSTVDH